MDSLNVLNSVIDVIKHPRIHLLNLISKILGEKYHLPIFLWQEMIKFRVEHSDDLAALVIDNCASLLVIQCGNRKSTLVVRVDFEVYVPKMRKAFM